MAVKPRMTVEEYWDYVKKDLTKSGYPQEYIDSVEQDARNQYDHCLLDSRLMGESRVNPSGFCYTCDLLYPDKPDVPPVKDVFNFKFQGVREKVSDHGNKKQEKKK